MAYNWKTIWQGETEPYISGGISYGGYTVLQQMTRGRRTTSKGWRRHLRRAKAAKRRTSAG